MRRLFLAVPALALVAVAGCSSGSHPAAAPSHGASTGTPTSPATSPSPSPSAPSGATLDVNNTAGWAVKSPGSALTTVTGSFTLTGASLSSHGSIGLQLCDSKTGYAVQFGAVPGSGGWTIGYFAGQLASTSGIDGDPCAGNEFLKTGAITSVGSAPTGTTLKAQISQQSPGHYVFTYATSNAASFSHRVTATAGQFDEAAAGASYPGVLFRGAVVNQLATFTSVTAASAAGVTSGLAAWTPEQVSSSHTGAPPIVLTASALSPASGKAPSSFAIVGGTPKL